VRSTVAPECPSGTTYNPATRTCIENITV
jgi:hypothetical protein